MKRLRLLSLGLICALVSGCSFIAQVPKTSPASTSAGAEVTTLPKTKPKAATPSPSKPQHKRKHKRKHKIVHTHKAITHVHTHKSAATASSAFSLVVEPKAGRAPILSFIESARTSVDLVMYEFDDPVLESALAADAKRGVKVRVLLNSGYYGSGFPQDDSAYSYFKAHGVAVRETPKYFALTHQKTIVVDNSRALILTLNLTEQYYASSRDFGVIDRNAADVAAIVKTFNADYTDQKITAPDGADLVWSPGSLAPTLSLINSAHKSLCIYNEEMDDATVVDALVRAAQRGVNVRVVMTSSSSWTANFKRLVAAGVHVRTYAASASLYIHAKMILVDGVRVFLGSENFSASSLDDNRELGLIITQPSIISDLTQVFDGDYAHAQAFSN